MSDERDPDDIVIPRGKPGRGLLRYIRGADVFRIGMFALLLVLVLVMRQSCGDATARFIGSFENPDAGAVTGDAGAVSRDPQIGEFRRLTDEEIRAIFNGDAGSLLDDE